MASYTLPDGLKKPYIPRWQDSQGVAPKVEPDKKKEKRKGKRKHKRKGYNEEW